MAATSSPSPSGTLSQQSPALPAAPRMEVAKKLAARMRNPLLFRLYLLRSLPLALAAGLRLREIDPERCGVSVPYGWRTTNPFRSTYFAALGMAAELSVAALATLAVESAGASVAMLIVELHATFEKKATALVTFTCEDGRKLFAAVAQTVATGEPATGRAESVGRLPDGTVVARFAATFSFKRRSNPRV